MVIVYNRVVLSDCGYPFVYYHRQVKQSEKLAKEEAVPFEHKDYSLKQGQKIHISLGVSTLHVYLFTQSQIRSRQFCLCI